MRECEEGYIRNQEQVTLTKKKKKSTAKNEKVVGHKEKPNVSCNASLSGLREGLMNDE